MAVIVSAFAEKSTRPLEIVIFAVVMTLLSGVLFKELLNLPIPFDPAGVIPSWINEAYAGLKRAIAAVFTAIRNLFGR